MCASRLLTYWIALWITAVATCSSADKLRVTGFESDESGSFRLGDIFFHIKHFDSHWKGVDQAALQAAPGFPRGTGGDVWETQGKLPVAGGAEPLQLAQRLKRLDDNGLRVNYLVTHARGIPTRALGLSLEIPLQLGVGQAVMLDADAVRLPAEFRDLVLAEAPRVRTLRLPGRRCDVIITADPGTAFSVLIQDERKFEGTHFTVRLQFFPAAEVLTKAGLTATVRRIFNGSQPVSLKAAANRGFRDDLAGDRSGGWTDQGPDNDMSPLKPGPLTAAGVDFEILDATANGGNGAVVLGRAEQSELPRSVTVTTRATAPSGYLYLLHATAGSPPNGMPVGTVRVRYADGSGEAFPVIAGRDVSDWWKLDSKENARVGWAGENGSAIVGLYVSRFTLSKKPVLDFTLEGSGQAAWMIAALSTSAEEIRTLSMPVHVGANGDWVPHQHAIDILPGSVFDFSSLTEAPAGKFGPIVATSDGHFEFRGRPGNRVRFWGVNLCFTANYLDRKEADALAERLKRSGYNAVRFHHFDGELIRPGNPSWEVDANKLDRLDYLFAALKKRGIYINIDLYTFRTFSDEEFKSFGHGSDDPEITDRRAWFKWILPISAKAHESWCKFAKRLLSHRNPYTGMTWAEDPALIGICPVNEDTITMQSEREPMLAAYEKLLPAWKEANPRLPKMTPEEELNLFLQVKQQESDTRMRDYLKSLGVQALITGTNFGCNITQVPLRERYDYVDDHAYQDHPSFPKNPWALPYTFRQGDAVKLLANVPRSMFASRILGKPFTCTEFNYVQPNKFRAQGMMLMPAYAGLQDWDAMYNFEYSSDAANMFTPAAAAGFSIVTDPISLLADRVGALMFRRGDVMPAPSSVVFAADGPGALGREKGRWPAFPADFTHLGLITRIGAMWQSAEEFLPGETIGVVREDISGGLNMLDGKGKQLKAMLRKNRVVAIVSNPSGDAESEAPEDGNGIYTSGSTLVERVVQERLKEPARIDTATRRFVSETGEIELTGHTGAFRVATPLTEGFVVHSGQVLRGQRVTVRNGEVFGSVVVTSVDGAPLEFSQRLLVVHLTNSMNTGMSFADEDLRRLDDTGRLPHLVRRGTADIDLRLRGDGVWRAYAVDATGLRKEDLVLGQGAEPGDLRLRASTVNDTATTLWDKTTLAYELVFVANQQPRAALPVTAPPVQEIPQNPDEAVDMDHIPTAPIAK
ncbi:hypothetical protein DB346_24915 [Verrucomicrobia bacterium LW23]|nr:hypothetical protein DB346_24915 [Verrucomicrobia bacterium LW23]